MTTYAYNDGIFTRTHIAIPDYSGGLYPETTDVYDIGTFTIIAFDLTGPADITLRSYGGAAAVNDNASTIGQAGPSTPSYDNLFEFDFSITGGSHHIELLNPFAGVGSANFAFAGMVVTSTSSGVPRFSAYIAQGHSPVLDELTDWRTAVAGRVSTAVLWAALGDSVTLGTGASDGAHKWVTLLDGEFDSYWGSYFTPTNDGVSGAKVSDIISGGYAAALDADTGLVTIELGINDSFNSVTVPTYTTNLTTLVTDVQAQCPNASIVIIGAHLVDTITAGTWPDYLDAMVAVAAANGCAYIEFYTVFGDPSTSPLLADGVHPNDAGHKVYADTLFRFLS